MTPISYELSHRIQREVRFYEGNLPERVAIAWHGYISALLEWNVIPVTDFCKLSELLPEVENNPVSDIVRGREEADEQAEYED